MSNVEPCNRANSSISLSFLMSFTNFPVLLQYLSMKKLLILSTSFVRLSTMKFFFLRLDRFIQFLHTSLVVIGLEFVLSNLRLTVSEDLLPLSFQESHKLFASRVLSLNFLALLVTSRQTTVYHDSLTTTTDRTTGLLLQSDRLVFGAH